MGFLEPVSHSGTLSPLTVTRPATCSESGSPRALTAAAGATATAAGTTAYRGHTPNCADQIATARNALANAF